MMKQSYTSFLNNVHKKANIHIFVIKVNKSTGQRVNELRPDGSDWVGRVCKSKTPIKSAIGFNGCIVFFRTLRKLSVGFNAHNRNSARSVGSV